jgi:hypothetical protein
LEQSHGVVGQIEFNIDLVEEILAQNHCSIFNDRMLTCNEHAPAFARSLTDAEIVDQDRFGFGLSADAEYPIAPGFLALQPESIRRGSQYKRHHRPGVEDDARLLTVDRAVRDQLVPDHTDRQVGDLEHLAGGYIGMRRASQHQTEGGAKKQRGSVCHFTAFASVLGSPREIPPDSGPFF